MKRNYLKLLTVALLSSLTLGLTACGGSASIAGPTAEEDIVIHIGKHTLPLTSTWEELEDLAEEYDWEMDASLYPGSSDSKNPYSRVGDIETELGKIEVRLMPNEYDTGAVIRHVSLHPAAIDSDKADILGVTVHTDRDTVEKHFESFSEFDPTCYKVDDYVLLRVTYSEDEDENIVRIIRTDMSARQIPEVIDVTQYVKNRYPDVAIDEEKVYTSQEITGEPISFGSYADMTISDDWKLSSWGFTSNIYSYTGSDSFATLQVFSVIAETDLQYGSGELAFAGYVKEKLNLIQDTSETLKATVSNFRSINIDDCQGYAIDVITEREDVADYTQIFLYTDGYICPFTVNFNYNGESLDPATMKEIMQSIANIFGSFILK